MSAARNQHPDSSRLTILVCRRSVRIGFVFGEHAREYVPVESFLHWMRLLTDAVARKDRLYLTLLQCVSVLSFFCEN